MKQLFLPHRVYFSVLRPTRLSRPTAIILAGLLLFPLASLEAKKKGGGKGGKTKVTAAEAARFLNQATFGPNLTLISNLQSQGFDKFLSQQLSTGMTSTLARVDQNIAGLPAGTNPSYRDFNEAWWHTVMTAPDQLRQRVALAQSEIMFI
jgi:hypothetical protein